MLTLLAFFLLVLPTAAAAGLSKSYGRLPLHFEENRGQTDRQVQFLARGPGYGVYLTAREAVLVLGAKERSVLRMALVGAWPSPSVNGLDELPGKANYFIGKDPSQWRTNVPTYAKVRYREVYPGIDLVYYGNQRQLEYDFVVAAGADPNRIALRLEGAEKLEIDAQGDLVLHAALGDMRVKKPVVYQEIEGARREIEGRFVLKEGNEVAFALGAYDTGKRLVIDPVLFYSTYLGGSGFAVDQARGIAVDAGGNAYVAGGTSSIDFPTTSGAFRATANDPTEQTSDIFVTKLNPTGTALVYSTYLGGSDSEGAWGIAVDASGNAYVAGGTGSADFPTTAGAFQTIGGGDAFVAKLDPSGSTLLYSTYLGGSEGDGASAIAIDSTGNAYVAGATTSPDFPTTPGAFQPVFVGLPPQGLTGSHNDGFVAKLNAEGSGLVYATFLGGSYDEWPNGIAVDAAGSAYITGTTLSQDFPITPRAFDRQRNDAAEAFVTKLDPAGSALVYSIYLGGSEADRGHGIAVDGAGHAYVTGQTDSIDFPTAVGVQPVSGSLLGGDAFVTKLNPDGSFPMYSTYLGGSSFDGGRGIAVDADGNAYVTGYTSSQNFPITLGALDTSSNGGFDAFVTKLNATGTAILYSTYLGGDGPDPIHGVGPARGYDEGRAIAVDANGDLYVTGITGSDNFPTTPGAFQPFFGGGLGDTFVACIRDVVLPIDVTK
jgi:hypothetical protein